MLTILYYGITLMLSLPLIIYLYFKYSYEYWKKKDIPFLAPSIPFGNVSDLIKEKINFGEKFAQLYKEGKKISKEYIGVFFFSQPVFIPLDPELIKTLLTKEFSKFTSRGLYYNDDVDPLSGNLVRLHGEKWKRIRSKLTPTFTSGKMKSMFQMLLNCAEQLETELDEHFDRSVPVEFKDLLEKLGTDVIGSCVFGIDCNSFKDPNSEFRKHAKLYFDSTMTQAFKFTTSQMFPKIFDLFQIPLMKLEVTKFFTDIFQNAVDLRIKSGLVRKDFIDLFMKVKNNEDMQEDDKNDDNKMNVKDVSYKELTAQAFSFFVAGLETSSSTMHFCIFELAINENIQDKVRDEIIEVLKNYNGEICYEAIMEMKYLDKVINETLRKYPPIPILNRECDEDYYTPEGRLILQKGNKIWIPLVGLHNDPDHFPDPDKFDPERFTEEEKLKRHPFAYLPFGEGPRICIGMRFGQLEVKVGLVTMLRNYKYSINPKTTLPCKFAPKGIFLSFADKVLFDVQRV